MTEADIRKEMEHHLGRLPELKAAEEKAAQAELKARATVDEVDWTVSKLGRPVADISLALQRWEDTRKALGQAQVDLGACHRRLAALAWHLKELGKGQAA